MAYGKGAVCSVWSELRLSLRIGHLSRVSVKIGQMVDEGVLANKTGLFTPYFKREIDHFWYPLKPGVNRPYAVAIGETKVFDLPFTADSSQRGKVYEQFDSYLNIASAIGAQMGLPPQLYYFFVAGVSQGQIDKMQRLTREFNDSLNGTNPVTRSPVELFVFGNYDAKK